MTELKKNPVGRPSAHMLAVREAEQKGEEVLKITRAELESKIESEVQLVLRSNCSLSKGRPVEYSHVQCGEPTNKSNRRILGAQAKRKELGAATKLVIAQELVKISKQSASEVEFRSAAVRRYGMTWKRLKHIWENVVVWKRLVEQMQLSKVTGAMKNSTSKFKKRHGVGCRKKGGGRLDKFKHVKLRLKAWLEKEREHGHFVDKADLVIEFMEQCADEVEACSEERERRFADEMEKKCQEEKVPLQDMPKTVAQSKCVQVGKYYEKVLPGFEGMKSPEEHVKGLYSVKQIETWKNDLQERICALAGSKKYRETFAGVLLKQMGAKLFQPKRMSLLSMEEEEARVKASWMQWDEKCM